MLWQDLAITGTNIVFTMALIPQIYYGLKRKKGLVAYTASLPTFISLFILAFTYYTLDLNFSSAMTALNGIVWFILFVQRWKYGSVEVDTKNELR